MYKMYVYTKINLMTMIGLLLVILLFPWKKLNPLCTVLFI